MVYLYYGLQYFLKYSEIVWGINLQLAILSKILIDNLWSKFSNSLWISGLQNFVQIK